MDKKTIILASIATMALVLSAVALSESYIVISEYHSSKQTPTPTSPESTISPQATPQPTTAPMATPNLSSSIRDNNQNIMVNCTIFSSDSDFTGLNLLWDLNVTDIGKSDITIITITYAANNSGYISNGTYPGTYGQILSPNTTAAFDWLDPPALTSIAVYYQIADQIYYHTISTFTLEYVIYH